MQLAIDIQNVSDHYSPTKATFHYWLETALSKLATYSTDHTELTGKIALTSSIEISIRIVDDNEIQQLNRDYRQHNKPTNILSFTADLPVDIQPQLLGDLVICAPVVAAEAIRFGKSKEAHWAHMVIHGLLHLLGYDHITDDEALEMEALEAKLLAELNQKIC